MGLSDSITNEKVSGLPLRELVAVSPDTPVQSAIAQMRDRQLGCAAILDDQKPVGIFTERSVLDALIQNASLAESPVSAFADPNFRVVKSSDTIRTVWDAILREGCRFLVVVDDHGAVAGFTGQRGLAEYVSEFFPRQVMVQRLGSKPAMGQREGA